MLPSSRLSAFPDLKNRVASGKFFPDYSGGTVPGLHRLPFYALAGTQEIAKSSRQCRALDVNGIKTILTFLLEGWGPKRTSQFSRLPATGNTQPEERRVHPRS